MPMVIESPNEFGTLDENALVHFEKQHGIRLPADYRAFLLEHNGGEPNPNMIDFLESGRLQSDIVRFFYGIHSGPEWARLDLSIEAFKGRMPDEFIPITADPFGNQFVLGVKAPYESKIYFWDHERELDEDSHAIFENMSFVANSFSEFLNLLHDE
jgi:cell wall assembly regulator SMI1